MFNPLAILTPAALEGFIREGKTFFVRQYFQRGLHPLDTATKKSFLFCHYESYFMAKEHFDALSEDPYRFLYNWNDADHQEKLRMAAAQPRGYKIYTNTFVPDWEKHLTDREREGIRAYIKKLGWNPGRGEGVQPKFYPHFGEVHVILKFRGREVRVNFAEIENLS